MNALTMTQVPTRNRLTLLTMVVVFAAPALAAWFYFLNPQYLPDNRSNRGELIQPMVTLDTSSGLTGPDGSAFDSDSLAGRWILVSLEGAACGEPCRQRLISLRQIRLALGQSRMSVERLLLLTGGDSGGVESEFPGMRVAFARQALLNHLGEGEAALGRIYILDPMGNLMMRYAADAPAKDTLKDMERLIKASKNWIKGAGYGHR